MAAAAGAAASGLTSGAASMPAAKYDSIMMVKGWANLQEHTSAGGSSVRKEQHSW
jgi:hypothetical protein